MISIKKFLFFLRNLWFPNPPLKDSQKLSIRNSIWEWVKIGFRYSFSTPVKTEKTIFGEVDVIFENKKFGVYVLRINPGREIPAHYHKVMEEWEMVLTEGLLLNGEPVKKGECFYWEKNCVHAYKNPTDTEQRILCIDCPAFIPSDEVLV